MTKSHRIKKKPLSNLPSILVPLVLTCALTAGASAQDTPTPNGQKTAETTNSAEQKAVPEPNAATDAGNTPQPKAEGADADAEPADTAEEITAAPLAQPAPEPAAKAQPAVAPQTADGDSVQRQPSSVLQSERIRPRAQGIPQMADPASRARSRQKRLEGIVRGVMSQAGFTDLPMQGYIAAHMANEDQARGPLRKKGEQLFLALKSVRVTNVQIDELLREFQKALDDDRARRLQCESNLDAKIGYSKNSRLQAVLVLFGIIGDGALFVPLREPPRPRQTVPAKSEAPAQQQDAAALVVSTPATTANGAAAARTDAAQAAAATPQPGDTAADSSNAKPSTYDVSAAAPVSKDRASFK